MYQFLCGYNSYYAIQTTEFELNVVINNHLISNCDLHQVIDSVFTSSTFSKNVQIHTKRLHKHANNPLGTG